MFGFFNSKNRMAAVLQVTNATGFILTAYDYFTNPDASASQSVPAMLNYAFNVFNLSENATTSTRLPGFLANVFSIGAIYRDYTSPCSTVSPYLNALTATHLLTTGLIAVDMKDDIPAATPKPTSGR